MLPKGKKTIRVQKVEYHYIVGRNRDVIVQNMETKKIQVYECDEHSFQHMNIQPGHVRGLILAGEDSARYMSYISDKKCGCGAEGGKVRRICAFDVEIRYDGKTPYHCHCCSSCRDRCADDV